MTDIYYHKLKVITRVITTKGGRNGGERHGEHLFGERRFHRVAPWNYCANSMAQHAPNSHRTPQCSVGAQFFLVAGATRRHACTEQALSYSSFDDGPHKICHKRFPRLDSVLLECSDFGTDCNMQQELQLSCFGNAWGPGWSYHDRCMRQ